MTAIPAPKGHSLAWASYACCIVVILTACSTAYPGPGKSQADLQHDIQACNNFPPQERQYIRNFTIERCLVSLGEIVKRPDGTIIYPSQPVTPTIGNVPNYVGPSTSPYVNPGEIDPATVSPPPPAE